MSEGNHASDSEGTTGGGGAAPEMGLGVKIAGKAFFLDLSDTQAGDGFVNGVGKTHEGFCPTKVGLTSFDGQGAFGLGGIIGELCRILAVQSSPHDNITQGIAPVEGGEGGSSGGGGGGDHSGGGGGGGSSDHEPAPSSSGGSSNAIVFEGHVEAPSGSGMGGFLASFFSGGRGGGEGMEVS